MISNACFKSFAAYWALVCYPIVVLWHPDRCLYLIACGMDTLGSSALFVELFWCVFRWSVCWVIVLSGHSHVLCFGVFAGARLGVALASVLRKKS